MIQKLLGSGGGGGSSSAPAGKTSAGFSTQPIFTASNAPSTAKENISATTQQNLRCPRCDSTNTKFCYYNNYNLTQPRHFCKTCRRYWTKGGTLRNVPIGGGCRKNKTSSHVSAGGSSSATSGSLKPSSNIAMGMANYKAKPTLSTEILLNGNSGFLGNMDPYSDLQNPPIWPSIQQGQSSHILALLRGATQFSNPNPNPNPSHVFTPLKTEGNNTTLGLDPYGNGAPSILGSFLRGNQQSLNGYGLGGPDVQNGGNSNSNILDLYQRLKSSGNYNYCGNDQNHGSMIFSNNVIGSSSSSPSPSASAMNFEGSNGGGDNLGGYGMMNSSMGISGWSDFPTIPINGAFP